MTDIGTLQCVAKPTNGFNALYSEELEFRCSPLQPPSGPADVTEPLLAGKNDDVVVVVGSISPTSVRVFASRGDDPPEAVDADVLSSFSSSAELTIVFAASADGLAGGLIVVKKKENSGELDFETAEVYLLQQAPGGGETPEQLEAIGTVLEPLDSCDPVLDQVEGRSDWLGVEYAYETSDGRLLFVAELLAYRRDPAVADYFVFYGDDETVVQRPIVEFSRRADGATNFEFDVAGDIVEVSVPASCMDSPVGAMCPATLRASGVEEDLLPVSPSEVDFSRFLCSFAFVERP